jgi:hypothetical protein
VTWCAMASDKRSRLRVSTVLEGSSLIKVAWAQQRHGTGKLERLAFFFASKALSTL